MPWRKGESGNPEGKPKGALARLSKRAEELAARYGYDPLEKQILLVKRVEAIVKRNHFADVAERLRHFEFLHRIYKDTMPYLYPQLRSLEITDDLDALVADPQSVEQQRESLAFLLRQVRELADEQGVTEDGDTREQGVA